MIAFLMAVVITMLQSIFFSLALSAALRLKSTVFLTILVCVMVWAGQMLFIRMRLIEAGADSMMFLTFMLMSGVALLLTLFIAAPIAAFTIQKIRR